MAEPMPKKVGFIGLGLMGTPMCQNLIKKLDPSTHFYLYDVVQDNMLQLQKEHGQDRIHISPDPKSVALESNIIITMLPEGTHVHSVYLDPSTGILSAWSTSPPPASLPTLLLDCSTIDTATSATILAATQTLPASPSPPLFTDAPVSGGVKGAHAATLTFMLGASPASTPRYPFIHALLARMGTNIFACGGPGLGLTAKQANNYCSALVAVAVSEAMNMGMRAGMDPRVLANVFHTSTAQTRILDDWSPVPGLVADAPSGRGYEGGFKIQLMKKDMGLAIDTARRVGATLALGDAGFRVYEQACRDPRCADRDSRVVYRFLGGDEEWQGRFPEEVDLKADETKALLKWALEERAKRGEE